MPIKQIDHPQPDEHSEYFGRYVKLVPEGHILPVLEAQISERRPWLWELEPARGQHRYEPGKWSLNEVLGHLNDCERVFQFRMLHAARSDASPLPGFDQDAWAATAEHHERPLREVLEEFDHIRGASIRLLRTFSPESLAASVSADGNALSVRAMAWILAGHEIHHRAVIQERYV